MKILDHEKLGISFVELGALLGTRAMLEFKVLEDGKELEVPNKKSHLFNMTQICKTAGCGSIACIGGTMAMIMGLEPTSYVRNAEGELKQLFYPHYRTGKLEGIELYSWGRIKPAEAIKVIDRFLRTGKAEWQKVLGAKRVAELQKLSDR